MPRANQGSHPVLLSAADPSKSTDLVVHAMVASHHQDRRAPPCLREDARVRGLYKDTSSDLYKSSLQVSSSTSRIFPSRNTPTPQFLPSLVGHLHGLI